MSDSELAEVSTRKVDFDITVRAGISVGLILLASLFLTPDTFTGGYQDRRAAYFFTMATVDFVPWLPFLNTLWKVRRRRHEGLLAEAEDIALVAGMLWMELALIGMTVFNMHFLDPKGETMFVVGLIAPMVLGSLTAVHTGIRLFFHGNSLSRSVVISLLMMAAASFPSGAMLSSSGTIALNSAAPALTGWFFAHALSFAAAYGAIILLNRANAYREHCSPENKKAVEQSVKTPLPNDKKSLLRMRIVSGLCAANLLYPFVATAERLQGMFFFPSFVGLLIPWIYWSSIVRSLRSEIASVAGEEYSTKVSSEWVTVMVTALSICGAWVSPAGAYYPVEMLIPLLGAIGLMFGLVLYIAPDCPIEKTARAAGIMSAGMVLPAVAHGVLLAIGDYVFLLRNPMLVSASLAVGNALVFFGLYQLREAMRFLATPGSTRPELAKGAAENPTETPQTLESAGTDQPDAAGSTTAVPNAQKLP